MFFIRTIMSVMIGLETHVQLSTNTKLFCGCSLKRISEAKPNTRCCPTCLGMPGSKPRLNKSAIEAAVKIALALECKINRNFFFSRKSYFYPDMSKNFQITQYEVPIAESGVMKMEKKEIRIRRINIEEDPAKLVHVGGSITTAKNVLVDYNRSGIPLCEIVTEPDFASPKEARIFLQKLAMVLKYLKVFEADEFSLKTDANISIEGGERVEVKNITGFREIEKALNYEIVRQRNIIRTGRKISRETRAWDAVSNVTKPLRTKEGEDDYGYIFEPDLTEIELTENQIVGIKEKLPELAHQKFERYQKEFSISKELSYSIASDIEMAQFFEDIAKNIEPKFAASWILVLKKILNYNDIMVSEMKMGKNDFEKLLNVIKSGKLSDRAGELVLREIVNSPEKLDETIERYIKTNSEELEKVVDNVLEKNMKAVNDYKSGNKASIEFLIGQSMRETGGKADAREIRKIIEKKLNNI